MASGRVKTFDWPRWITVAQPCARVRMPRIVPSMQSSSPDEKPRIKHEPWTGLVLSGGGARGAYEAGVLRYIREQLPEKTRARVRFEIIAGTSVGALNACF